MLFRGGQPPFLLLLFQLGPLLGEQLFAAAPASTQPTVNDSMESMEVLHSPREESCFLLPLPYSSLKNPFHYNILHLFDPRRHKGKNKDSRLFRTQHSNEFAPHHASRRTEMTTMTVLNSTGPLQAALVPENCLFHH